jgi:tetraacyldisaccharide 4'-kinase
MVFPDHHVYAERDVAAVTQRAKALGADALVTTAKDAVRWPEQALDVPQRILKVSVSVEPEDDFRALVRRAVAARMEESGR